MKRMEDAEPFSISNAFPHKSNIELQTNKIGENTKVAEFTIPDDADYHLIFDPDDVYQEILFTPFDKDGTADENFILGEIKVVSKNKDGENVLFRGDTGYMMPNVRGTTDFSKRRYNKYAEAVAGDTIEFWFKSPKQFDIEHTTLIARVKKVKK